MADFDLAIIGGGINGVGIARDAAGRGIRVVLIEQNDLGAGTSSASTKLIHGGLENLERGAWRRLRATLPEREVLLRTAPHLVRPLRFVLPQGEAMRPGWQLRLGLFVYDRLGRRKLLRPAEVIDLTHHPIGIPLKRSYRQGFEYSDCRVDDARLVVLTALDAAERGAVIRPRTRLVRADRQDDAWQIVVNVRGRREQVTARVLVNAGGAWANQLGETVLRGAAPPVELQLLKGSHIIVRKVFDHDRAYVFPSGNRRVVYAIPYERDFTLLGTTESEYHGDPAIVVASPAEITYLCRAAGRFFRQPVEPTDVVRAFAGVRVIHPELDAGRHDHVLHHEVARGQAPLLTVYGGDITTHRKLAEAVLERIGRYFGVRPAWTRAAPLPGGDFPWDAMEAIVARTRGLWPFLGEAEARRLVGAYGTRVERVLGEARSHEDLGPRFGAELTAAEVRYLMRHEWAETAEDVLWRRSKLGLHIKPDEETALARFMGSVPGQRAAAE